MLHAVSGSTATPQPSLRPSALSRACHHSSVLTALEIVIPVWQQTYSCTLRIKISGGQGRGPSPQVSWLHHLTLSNCCCSLPLQMNECSKSSWRRGESVSSAVGGNSKLASDCRVLGAARQDGSWQWDNSTLFPPRKTWLNQPAWWQEMGTLRDSRSVATSVCIFASAGSLLEQWRSSVNEAMFVYNVCTRIPHVITTY
jgi:hypothetical protein